jgi:hypothetical protein
MEPKVTIQRKGEELQLTIKIAFRPGCPMLEGEEQIQQALNEAGALATGELLERFDADGSPIVVGGVKFTSKGRVGKEYQSQYGVVEVSRHVYQTSQGGATFCPLDQQARIVNSSTPRFAKMCSSKFTTMNSVLAQKDLRENHGREVSRCYLQGLVDDVALIAEDKEESWRYAEPELPRDVKTVSVGVDGTCMLYCEDGYRVAMVGTISLYDDAGDRLHTVYVAGAPEYGRATFFQRMDEELRNYKARYGGAKWLGVADGAHDHWPWLEGWTDQSIVDFWHAAGYLEKAAPGVCPRGQNRRQWFEESRRRLKEQDGAAEDLLGEMKNALRERRPKGTTLKGLEAAISYYENHLPKMNYAQYRRESLAIGSGVTEAACKTVVKQRLCGSGMKWKYSGAAAVLRLRTLILTEGRWQQFWDKISRFGF